MPFLLRRVSSSSPFLPAPARCQNKPPGQVKVPPQAVDSGGAATAERAKGPPRPGSRGDADAPGLDAQAFEVKALGEQFVECDGGPHGVASPYPARHCAGRFHVFWRRTSYRTSTFPEPSHVRVSMSRSEAFGGSSNTGVPASNTTGPI